MTCGAVWLAESLRSARCRQGFKRIHNRRPPLASAGLQVDRQLVSAAAWSVLLQVIMGSRVGNYWRPVWYSCTANAQFCSGPLRHLPRARASHPPGPRSRC